MDNDIFVSKYLIELTKIEDLKRLIEGDIKALLDGRRMISTDGI